MKLLSYSRRCHFPLMLLYSAFAPVMLLLSRHAESLPMLLWLLPVVPTLLCCVCLALPGRLRMLPAALFAAGTAALLWLCPAARAYASVPTVMLALLLCALPMAGHSEHDTSPVFYAAGVLAHLGTQALIRVSGYSDMQTLFDGPMTFVFVVYLVLLVLALNRISLDNASLARYRLPASMRRVNRLLTLAFLALTLLLSSLPVVLRALYALWQAVRFAAAQFGALLTRLLGSPPVTGGVGAPGFMHIPEAAIPAEEPSLFFVIMEHAATLLTLIAFIAGSVILLRMLVRFSLRMLRLFYARLRRYAFAVSEDYVDEVTDTREEAEADSLTILRIRRRAASGPEPQEPGEKVRFRYARLLRRHPDWADSSTARENLRDIPAAIYERARYSDHPVSREDADAFSAGTRSL